MRGLAGELRFQGSTSSLFLGKGVLPDSIYSCSPLMRFSPPRQGKGRHVTICKYNGRRRRSTEKSPEQKLKEFKIRKEEMLQRSRMSSRKKVEEEAEALGPMVIMNEEGAQSVSVLQPIDDTDYPQLAEVEASDRSRTSSVASWGTSLMSTFSQFVVQDASTASLKSVATLPRLRKEDVKIRPARGNGTTRSRVVKHVITQREEGDWEVSLNREEENGTAKPRTVKPTDTRNLSHKGKVNGTVEQERKTSLYVEKQQNFSLNVKQERENKTDSASSISLIVPDSPDPEEDEEWIEVGLNDGDEEEEEEQDNERVEYWEGDLPPMSPEEEEELLREAELELAELERAGGYSELENKVTSHQPGVGFDYERRLALENPKESSETVEMKRKLAKMKMIVKRIEENISAEATKSMQGVAGNFDRESEVEEEYEEGDDFNEGDDEGDEFDEEDDEEDDFDEDEDDEEEEVDDKDEKYELPVRLEQQSSDGSDAARIESKKLSQPQRGQTKDYWELDCEEELEVKDRGIPAVMRCFDRAKIFVKAGDGGNGVVAFRREKFVPFGGPYGGTGGRGGHVYIETDPSMNSLLPFRKTVHFRASRGSHGGGKRKEGAVGADCIVRVPPGTLIREAGADGKVLLEMTKPGQCEMLLPGGAGGRGNAAFKTGRNNAPQLAEFGEAGADMWVELELKLVADVGIVGVPNAGKSTLLSAISAAKPEIASYPFTTLLPNLGVVALDYDDAMVVADLPGLLEGAHTGIGLGYEFLRHTERCRVLVHVVDGMSVQPVEEFEAVRLELQLFNPMLSEKPFVVAYNKMDIPEAAERWEAFRQGLCCKGVEALSMSAVTQEGTTEVIRAAHELLRKEKEFDTEIFPKDEEKAMAVAEIIRRQQSAPIEYFTINADKHTRTWQVEGAGLERFTQMTNWEYFESVRRFQHVLSASGVNKALRERGIREGDTVVVGEMEFSWIDSEDMSALPDWKRGVRGSKVWPH